MMNDSALRQSMIEKGKQRLNDFSWEQTAAKTVNIYKKALGYNRL
jgi:glycosyltransferase involved in cell wall biosynthesis